MSDEEDEKRIQAVTKVINEEGSKLTLIDYIDFLNQLDEEIDLLRRAANHDLAQQERE